jgi:hypothetical protein
MEREGFLQALGQARRRRCIPEPEFPVHPPERVLGLPIGRLAIGALEPLTPAGLLRFGEILDHVLPFVPLTPLDLGP